jgi:hypothetical protein
MNNYDVFNVLIGNGCDIYNEHKDNKEELRSIVFKVIEIGTLLKDDNYEWGSYSRPAFIENCTNFLKKYNTRDLWTS